MPSAWRLTKTKYLSSAWDGEGARKAGGRWNAPGVAVVYTSGTLSLALVEVLVHLPSDMLAAYSAIPIEFDGGLVSVLPPADLPSTWKHHPPSELTQAIGGEWVAGGKTAILRVPSVVVPGEWNFLLNPAHPDFGRIRIGGAMAFPFDPRLLAHAGAFSGYE